MIQAILALHIPDGFLDGWVAAGAAAVAGLAVLVGLRRANVLDERKIPVLGVAAAFIFAAQMLNFPVAGGTSGHFLGAALAAILLGPWVACLVMAVVLSVQAFVFADGGLTALGANVLNMGVIGALLVGFGMLALRRVLPKSRGALLGVVATGAWLAVMLGAFATSVELGVSGTVPFSTVLPAMLGVHALIGIGEAVITAGAVAAILATRPDLIAIRGLTQAELGRTRVSRRPATVQEA
jgi:cobalt/nickel transport system permease protein